MPCTLSPGLKYLQSDKKGRHLICSAPFLVLKTPKYIIFMLDHFRDLFYLLKHTHYMTVEYFFLLSLSTTWGPTFPTTKTWVLFKVWTIVVEYSKDGEFFCCKVGKFLIVQKTTWPSRDSNRQPPVPWRSLLVLLATTAPSNIILCLILKSWKIKDVSSSFYSYLETLRQNALALTGTIYF